MRRRVPLAAAACDPIGRCLCSRDTGPHFSPARRLLRRVKGVRLVFSRAPAPSCGSFEEKQPMFNEDEPPMNTNRHEDRWTSFKDNWRQNASALLSRWRDPVMGESPTGFRNRWTAPWLCFGRAHAVPAGRAVGCNIAGKLSGNPRDSMRAGRPRSRGCRPHGEVGGIRRATSLKAGLSPLGNSRLPASRAPAPRDWADPSRRTINGTSMHRIIRTGGCCRRG